MLFVPIFLICFGISDHNIVVGSSITFEATTQYHDGVIPNAFSLRCSPQTQGNCAKTIISIQVSREADNTILASIQGADSISYTRLLRSSVTAEGHIDEHTNETFLSVTVNEAVKEDSGLYACRLVYLDEYLHVHFESANVNVSITGQDTKDIIKHLMSKISFLENLVQFQQDELSGVKVSLVDQGTQLQSQTIESNRSYQDLLDKMSSLERKLTEVETDCKTRIDALDLSRERKLQDEISQVTNELKVQEDVIRDLNDKEKKVVFFLALHTRSGVLRSGADMKFSDVISNVGGAYQGSTGVFTAPVTGYYMFQVSAGANSKAIIIDLKSSKGQVLTRLRVHYDFTDTSCVVKLNAGVQVRPVIRHISGGFRLRGFTKPYFQNKFFGYLLKAL